MADFAARRTAMVDTQVRPSDITKFPIIEAMLAVPKEEFVPDNMRPAAYLGENLPLVDGRVILEARTLGKMLDFLDISSHETVLDLGCGYGYSSAILARMANAVVAIESDEAMAADAQERLSRLGADNVAVMAGPLAEGDAKHGPYDVIILQGGVESVPENILSQLRDGGRICAIFIEGALGTCRIGHKSGGNVSWRYAFNAGAPVLPGFEHESGFAL
jgi:protein-L-isoaspartate(D-aspartate) O-methyltransferase